MREKTASAYTLYTNVFALSKGTGQRAAVIAPQSKWPIGDGTGGISPNGRGSQQERRFLRASRSQDISSIGGSRPIKTQQAASDEKMI